MSHLKEVFKANLSTDLKHSIMRSLIVSQNPSLPRAAAFQSLACHNVCWLCHSMSGSARNENCSTVRWVFSHFCIYQYLLIHKFSILKASVVVRSGAACASLGCTGREADPAADRGSDQQQDASCAAEEWKIGDRGTAATVDGRRGGDKGIHVVMWHLLKSTALKQLYYGLHRSFLSEFMKVLAFRPGGLSWSGRAC